LIATFVSCTFLIGLTEPIINFSTLTANTFVVHRAVLGTFAVDPPAHGSTVSDLASDFTDGVISAAAWRERDAHLVPYVAVGVIRTVQMGLAWTERARILGGKRPGIWGFGRTTIWSRPSSRSSV